MNQDTPARTIRQKDLDANSSTFDKLLERIPKDQAKTVLDIRYGLGGWARKIMARFPKTHILRFEQDPDTFNKALDQAVVASSLINSRFDPSLVKGRKFDLVCADFNTLTVLKRELLDQVVSEVETRRIIFTDVACCKLHLNYRSYGLTSPDLSAYWNAFKIPGFELSAFAKEHHAASSALYIKK